MRRVLVTGAHGFIGAYVLAALHARNITALCFDRFAGNLQHPSVDVFLGDVLDPESVQAAVMGCDGVIHLAGVLGTQETVDHPRAAATVNIMGALNVFEACRIFHKPCVYIAVGNYWMENTYAISKTTAERFARMYEKEHGTPIAIVRAMNAYGPGQKVGPVRKIIPSFITRALEQQPVQIYGDGLQVMDMIHASDVGTILVKALEWAAAGMPEAARDHMGYLRPLEAGSGHSTTVNVIAKEVIWAVRERTGIVVPIEHLTMRPGEHPGATVVANTTTLAPLYPDLPPARISDSFRSLQGGITETVAYYRDLQSSQTQA